MLFPQTPVEHRSPVSAASSTSSSIGVRRTKQELRVHAYRCQQYNADFDIKSDLDHHVQSHMRHPERTHVCAFCSKRSSYAKDLRRHRSMHDGVTCPCSHPSCIHASLGFNRKDNLDRHLKRQHPVNESHQQSTSQHPNTYGLIFRVINLINDRETKILILLTVVARITLTLVRRVRFPRRSTLAVRIALTDSWNSGVWSDRYTAAPRMK